MSGVNDTPERNATNARYFRNSLLVSAWVTAALFYYWVAFPVANMHFENPGPNGIPVDHRYGVTWWLVFPVLFVGLMPVLSVWTLARGDSIFRVDLHLLGVVLSILGTAVCALGALGVGWFWCSTLISGPATACNAYDYCCYYGASVPSQCPVPAVPCLPAPVGAPGWSAEWVQHFWITVAFFFLSFIYWSINYDLRVSGVVRIPDTRDSKREARIVALVLIFGSALLFYWFAGFIVPNLQFVHGYPLFDVQSPGPYVSYLYRLQWVAVYALNVNVLPPLLLAVALLTERRHALTGKYHLRVSSYVVAIINVAVFFYLLFVLIFNTNDWLFGTAWSISNSDEYCCEHFDAHPDVCPNVGPCVEPSPRALGVNGVFVQLIVATLLFGAVVTTHIVMNTRLVAYRLLYSRD